MVSKLQPFQALEKDPAFMISAVEKKRQKALKAPFGFWIEKKCRLRE